MEIGSWEFKQFHNGVGFFYREENKMKLIDLLNKIANGEEVPKKIKFHHMTYQLGSEYNYCKDYMRVDGNEKLNKYLINDKWALTNNLNDKIEIIEEDEYEPFEEDKKIEKIQLTNGGLTLHENNNDYTLSVIHKSIINKINKIIDKLNNIEQE